MDVRLIREVAPPGVQHGRYAEQAPEALRIEAEFDERGACRGEHRVEDRTPVELGYHTQLRRQRELVWCPRPRVREQLWPRGSTLAPVGPKLCQEQPFDLVGRQHRWQCARLLPTRQVRNDLRPLQHLRVEKPERRSVREQVIQSEQDRLSCDEAT